MVATVSRKRGRLQLSRRAERNFLRKGDAVKVSAGLFSLQGIKNRRKRYEACGDVERTTGILASLSLRVSLLSARCHVGKNSPPDCFFPKPKGFSLLVRFPHLVLIYSIKKQIPTRYLLFYGAGDGNRTHTTSLEGWDSTTELHPQIFAKTALI